MVILFDKKGGFRVKEVRIAKRALFLWEIAALIGAAALACAILLIFIPGTWLWYLLLWLVGAIYILTAFLILPLYHLSFVYRVTSKELLVHSGLLFTRSKYLLRSRIAFVAVSRGPLMRFLGLSTLTVHAAGAHLSFRLLRKNDAEMLAGILSGDAL